MRNATQPYGRYEADPAPFVALFAIAAGLLVSAPALLLGIALARLARRARVAFAILAAFGTGWVDPRLEPDRVRAASGAGRHRARRGGAR